VAEHAATDGQSATDSEMWQRLLVDGHGPLLGARRVFRYLPSAPRCKVCHNPFGGVGGRLASVAGFKRSRKNPELCSRCCDSMPRGGAEIDLAVLFADIRGSTALGRETAPSDYAELLNRFYGTATEVLIRHGAVIDKLIGDEVMALFIPGMAGPSYRRRAVEAGLALLGAVGYGSAAGPWLSLGAAVNAGVAYTGNVGEAVVDFTALGDPINVAARLQGEAAGGELLVPAGLADDLTGHAPRRSVAIRGLAESVSVSVLAA
jgi:adenylate cyclase